MADNKNFNFSNIKLGLAGIDKQHKTILEDISEILTSSSIENSLFLKKIQKLKIIMFQHYTTEEIFMKNNSYIDYDKHKIEHDKLKNIIEDLESKIADESITLTDRYKLLESLLRGLILQIHSQDKKMIDYLAHKYEDKLYHINNLR
jgi:hemerythrin